MQANCQPTNLWRKCSRYCARQRGRKLTPNGSQLPLCYRRQCQSRLHDERRARRKESLATLRRRTRIVPRSHPGTGSSNPAHEKKQYQERNAEAKEDRHLPCLGRRASSLVLERKTGFQPVQADGHLARRLSSERNRWRVNQAVHPDPLAPIISHRALPRGCVACG